MNGTALALNYKKRRGKSMDKKVEQTVRDYLNAQHLTYNTISDTWEGEIYADYYDELSGELIKKILQDDNPMDKFYELLSEI
jgi:hypothetical protein